MYRKIKERMRKYLNILVITIILIFSSIKGFSTVSLLTISDSLIVPVTFDTIHIQNPDTVQNSVNDSTDKITKTTPQQLTGNDHVQEIPAFKYVILQSTKTSDTINHYFVNNGILKHRLDSLMKFPVKPTDSLMYSANPFFLPLVFLGKDLKPVWDGKIDYMKEFYPESSTRLQLIPEKDTSTESVVFETRKIARDYISNHAAHLYETTFDQLPDPGSFLQKSIRRKPVETFAFDEKGAKVDVKKIDVVKLKQRYWSPKATALMQFTQNYISQNWYQGGNSNLAILNILTGEMNYDNKKNVLWENKLEWRAGFNSVDGDTIRKISTNDDVLRYTSKFGLKAGGNWYYSVSGDFSTQLFDNYKAINSTQYKARLLTPFRANIGIGMDYKYKKLLSLMLAPVSFKYIYANDTVNVNPNLFGIQKGQNQLRQLGSSFRAQLDYDPTREWQIDSKLTFYTDYKKVEIDLEVVSNLTVNRFMSVRVAVNPRYDNTVIMKKGENAKIQFKQLLSIGFSYRLL